MAGWDPHKEIFSQPKWEEYTKAVSEIYRVASRLSDAARHYHVPPSPLSTKIAASWSVLTALLKVDDPGFDYSESWDNLDGGKNDKECALCHIPVAAHPDPTVQWDNVVYHVSCANLWANRVSKIPPHIKQ